MEIDLLWSCPRTTVVTQRSAAFALRLGTAWRMLLTPAQRDAFLELSRWNLRDAGGPPAPGADGGADGASSAAEQLDSLSSAEEQKAESRRWREQQMGFRKQPAAQPPSAPTTPPLEPTSAAEEPTASALAPTNPEPEPSEETGVAHADPNGAESQPAAQSLQPASVAQEVEAPTPARISKRAGRRRQAATAATAERSALDAGLVEIRDTGTPKGMGVFATTDIEANAFIGEYTGEVLTAKLRKPSSSLPAPGCFVCCQSSHVCVLHADARRYPKADGEYVFQVNDDYFIDGVHPETSPGPIRYTNHRCGFHWRLFAGPEHNICA